MIRIFNKATGRYEAQRLKVPQSSANITALNTRTNLLMKLVKGISREVAELRSTVKILSE